jgi:hypothetical protein
MYIRFKELMVTAAMSLGLKQRNVRVFQQSLGICTVVRVHADAYAHDDAQVLVLNAMRSAHCGEYLPGCGSDIRHASHFRKQNYELISTLTTDGVGAAHASHQAPSDRLQHLIPDRLTQGVVDVL